MSNLNDRITKSLSSRSDRQILRSLSSTPTDSTSPSLVDFSSNDYLSFSRSPLLRKKLLSALNSLPSGSSPYGPPSSRLLDGNSNLHISLENQLTDFFRSESSLLFNSGFDANVGIFSCLPTARDFIIYDELIHASTHDGMRASRVSKENRRSFKHNDLSDLERLLREVEREEGVRNGVRDVWIAVETLYSMDGDLAPLAEMVKLVDRVLDRGNGHFVVDEAHSSGLYGPQGRGIVCALGLAHRITVRVHTFGKSLACSGAIVLCNPLIRSYLINYARPLIYSTVMPHMNVLAISKAFDMLEEGHGDEPATQIHLLSSLLLSHLSTFLSPTSYPLSLPPTLPSVTPSPPLANYVPLTPLPSLLVPMLTTTPIVPLLTPYPRKLSLFLREKGFLVRPISWPTVERGKERVRVCLHAANTKEEVRELGRAVKEWFEMEGGKDGGRVRL